MLIAQTEAEELPTVIVNPYFSFGPVTKAVSEMKQHLGEFGNEELVKVAKTGGGGSHIRKHWHECPGNLVIILRTLELLPSMIQLFLLHFRS